MKEIENREREDAYRRQELDAKLMGTAQEKNDVAAKICSCGNKKAPFGCILILAMAKHWVAPIR